MLSPYAIFLQFKTSDLLQYLQIHWIIPADTGLKLNGHKTFGRCLGRLLNVLCTFNLRPVSTGILLAKTSGKLVNNVVCLTMIDRIFGVTLWHMSITLQILCILLFIVPVLYFSSILIWVISKLMIPHLKEQQIL